MGNNLRTRGFTMLELLLGVGILAFLFTIVVVFLDPASILAETRDSTRISELQKLHDVIYLARISNSALLSNVQQNVIYVSLPDTDGDQYCNEYALPVVEAPWNYRCLASVETISNTDGNGWIPVNLSLVAQTQGGETLSRLPVDPKNNEAYFYTYNGGATVGSYSLVVRLESEKYVAQEASADGGLEENNEIFETVPVSYTPETPPETPPPPPLVPPSVTTTSASGITSTGAVLNAQGDPNGGSATGWFRYSTVDPGACSDSFGTRVPSSEGTNLGFGTDPVIFLRSLSGLLPDTIYYFCAIASNSAGSGFGSVLSFITSTPPTPLPNVTTNSASSIDSVSATLNGQANPNGSATTGWFRYSAVDPVTCNDSFGTRVPVLGGTNLGAGSANVPYLQNISSLSSSTTYYFCAIASNAGGTAFGGVFSFATSSASAWTQRNIDTDLYSQFVMDFIYDSVSGKYLAVGQDSASGGPDADAVLWESTDLNSWTQRSIDTSVNQQQAYSIIYANSKYVVGGYDYSVDTTTGDAVVWESPDLINWTKRVVGSGSGLQSALDLLYSSVASKYVVGGRDGSDATVWESSDLVVWIKRSVDTGANSQAIKVLFYNPVAGKYVAAGEDGASGNADAVIWESTDLVTWTQRNVDMASGSQKIDDLVYNLAAAKYVAAGEENVSGSVDAVVWESADLTTWTRHNVATGALNQATWSLVYNPMASEYLAVGYDASLGTSNAVGWTSSNLIDWTQETIDVGSGTQIAGWVFYDSNNGRYLTGSWDDDMAGDPDAVVWERPMQGGGGGNLVPREPTSLFVGYPSAQTGTSNPTSFVYSTPFFSAVYDDPDVGDTATKYRIQITPASDIGYTTPVFDSGAAGTSLIAPCGEGARCGDIFYNGSSLLSEGENYIWRIKFWDAQGGEGVWSSNGTIGMAAETLTARFFVGPGDGVVYASGTPCCNGGTWVTVQGLSVGQFVDSLSGSGWVGRTRSDTPSSYIGIQRGFFPIDTSRLPDNANVQMADLNIYVTSYDNYLSSSDHNYFAVVSGTQASPTVLVTEDYDQAGPMYGAPEGSDQITVGAASASGMLNAWKTWTLNATGLPWVSRTSYTKLAIRDGFDLNTYYQDGKTQFYNYLSENPGINLDPYLEVTYKMPGQPIVTTSPATNISSVSADLNGSANPNGTSTTGWFRYSTSNPGTCNDTFGTRWPPTGGTSLGSGTSPASYDYTTGGLTSQVTYYFCAIASNSLGTGFGDVLSFATTAIAWVQRFIDNSVENQLIADITYDSVGGKYIAAGARESSGVYYATVWESTDLTNWTRRDVNTDVRSFLNSVVYANGKYVGAGFEDISGNYNAVVWESSNLINWTQRNVDTAASIQEIYAIIYANGKYIAAGADGGSPFGANAIVWESGDLISWTKRTVGAQDSWGTSITFANGKYIVGGYMNPGSNGQAVVWESPNLASWTKRTVDAGSGQATRITESIAYFNGKYLAVTWGDYLEGGNEPRGRIFESSDLINWTMHELSASPNQVNDINYRPADGLYVVGGHDGMWEEVLLFESTDLINWTKRTLSSGEADASIESVFYNPSDGKYMAAGYIDSTGGNANAVLWELW